MNPLAKLIERFIPPEPPGRWKYRPTWEMLHPAILESIDANGEIQNDSPFVQSIETPVPYCHTFPLFSEEYCDFLIEVAEKRGKWQFDKRDDYTAWEQNLNYFPWLYGYHRAFVLFEVLNPIIAGIYKGWAARGLHRAFFIKYEKPICTNMEAHHDHESLVSISINLNDEFDGGGLRFSRYPEIEVVGRKGWAVMFSGNPVMRHEALPITDGLRYVLVYWAK